MEALQSISLFCNAYSFTILPYNLFNFTLTYFQSIMVLHLFIFFSCKFVKITLGNLYIGRGKSGFLDQHEILVSETSFFDKISIWMPYCHCCCGLNVWTLWCILEENCAARMSNCKVREHTSSKDTSPSENSVNNVIYCIAKCEYPVERDNMEACDKCDSWFNSVRIGLNSGTSYTSLNFWNFYAHAWSRNSRKSIMVDYIDKQTNT